jgi:hypothetical protein
VVPAGLDIKPRALQKLTVIPQPPTIPFNGLPSFLEAACIHPMFPHKVVFFKSGQVYTYNLDTTTHETTEPMTEIFPEFNGSISSILRTNYKQLNADGEVTYWDISIWSTEDIYYTYIFNVHTFHPTEITLAI